MSDQTMFPDADWGGFYRRMADNLHACTGDACEYCNRGRTGVEAKAAGQSAARRDHLWWAEADAWVGTLPTGAQFTADDLTAVCGKPEGSANQIGARITTWRRFGIITAAGITQATRPQSHARLMRVWEVI